MSAVEMIARLAAESATRVLGVALEVGGIDEIDALAADIGNGAAQHIAIDPIAIMIAAARMFHADTSVSVQVFSSGASCIDVHATTQAAYAHAAELLGCVQTDPTSHGDVEMDLATSGSLGESDRTIRVVGPRRKRTTKEQG